MPNSETRLVMYGAAWCPDVIWTKLYLKRHRVRFEYRDIDKNPDAMTELLALRGKAWVVPTVVLADGTVLDNPSRQELANRLDL